ncbi:hypothetical protein IB234_08825 [Pseudomonas sp. PDM16]|uniref:hypothetical protein n=1 Tax=Pseudomonas sp. PDM16 TaxID=2769292 RepID=UPI0017855390|nr:hypothetical protein [Pseudomonas sp. PDM16]MBD9414666.1 hypothetical protein [Pseudomonas sp. PDM16]
MDRTRPIALAALLMMGLPALAGEWPPGVRDTFQKSCVNSAGQALGQARAQQYCECTVRRIDRDFSSAELAALEKAELPEPLVKRLQQVSGQCLNELGGQG